MTASKLGAAFVIGALLSAVFVLWQKPAAVFGNVQSGESFNSTTTPAVASLTNLCPQGNNAASSTTGTLEGVFVLKSGGGILNIYDATTTNVNLRSSDQSTTSIMMTPFGASQTAGAYPLHASFKRGLLVEYTNAGTGIASTTITYTCGS